MNPNATRTRWIIILAVLLVLFGAAFLALPYADAYVLGPAKGWIVRTFHTPPIVRAGFVEDFDPQRSQAQLEKLISTYKSRQGSYGLRRTVTSAEGTAIGKCLVTENGELTFVTDLTRDPDSTRGFSIVHPTGVSPAPADQGTNGPAGGPVVRFYLITQFQGRGIAF